MMMASVQELEAALVAAKKKLEEAKGVVDAATRAQEAAAKADAVKSTDKTVLAFDESDRKLRRAKAALIQCDRAVPALECELAEARKVEARAAYDDAIARSQDERWLAATRGPNGLIARRAAAMKATQEIAREVAEHIAANGKAIADAQEAGKLLGLSAEQISTDLRRGRGFMHGFALSPNQPPTNNPNRTEVIGVYVENQARLAVAGEKPMPEAHSNPYIVKGAA